jgi:hypothetical protein
MVITSLPGAQQVRIVLSTTWSVFVEINPYSEMALARVQESDYFILMAAFKFLRMALELVPSDIERKEVWERLSPLPEELLPLTIYTITPNEISLRFPQ